jgi:hypothetical protein
VAAGYGLSAFVRGTGARYIQPAGRYGNGSSDVSTSRRQLGLQLSLGAAPSATPGRNDESPTRMYSPAGAESSAVVSFEAVGPSAAASKSTNQTEPFGTPFDGL